MHSNTNMMYLMTSGVVKSYIAEPCWCIQSGWGSHVDAPDALVNGI